jgi:DNA polymerase-3 subunit epsilon
VIITFFDTETTGFPNYKAPNDHPSQPHLIQLALLMMDTRTWEPVMKLSTLVAAPVESNEGALKAHGITKEMTDAFGIQPKTAAAFVRHYASRSERMVAHNKGFDMKLLNIEQARHGNGADPFDGVHVQCTMEITTPILELPPTEKQKAMGFTKFKPPKLSEAYEFSSTRDSLARMMRWWIRRRV